MKHFKKYLLILGMILFCVQAHADTTSGKVENVFNAVSTGNTGQTIYSRTFVMSSNRTPNIGYWAKIHRGATSTSLTMQICAMGSWDDVLADYATTSTVVLSSSDASSSSTIAFPYMKYVKFQATTLSGQNDIASTGPTITTYIFTQE